MNSKKIVLGLGLLLLGLPAMASACTPCIELWDLRKTQEQADVVLVGQKVAEEKAEYPQWIDVRVTRVLKGRVEGQQIRVASWYGHCSYGIIVDDKPSLMFLVGADRSQGGVYDDAVNHGCAVKTLVVENNSVHYDGEVIGLDAFDQNLNPSADRSS